MIPDTSAQDRPLARSAIARPWRRWLPRIAAALVVVGGLVHVTRGWLGASQAVDRARLRIARVERGTLVRDVVADGTVVAANSPTLYAIAAGTVDFHVRAGDTVRRGQSLATIASPDLQSRLAQEQATLAGLEAEVGRAQLDVEHGKASAQKLIAQADIDQQSAARDVEMNQQMFAHGVIAEVELRHSQDTLEKAKITAKFARTDAALQEKQLAFDLGTKQQTRDRQQEVVRDLERQVAALEITSPVDGQVGQLLVPQRASVAANTGVISVVDLSALEVEIRVPDSFARDLAIGMSAEISEGTTKFAGRVRSVAPEVVDGNVATRLEFVGERPAGLRQNQRLSARILIDRRENVLKVERGTFVDQGGGNTAYFVDGDYAERRPIRTGAISFDAVEILAGAHVGDQIVVSGTDAFGNASRVRLAN